MCKMVIKVKKTVEVVVGGHSGCWEREDGRRWLYEEDTACMESGDGWNDDDRSGYQRRQ